MTTVLDEFRRCRDRWHLHNDKRQMVLFIGSGLHYHLKGTGIAYPSISNSPGASLASWNDLLSSVRMSDNGEPEFPAADHTDPTSVWESLVLNRTRKRAGATASANEDHLLRRVAKRIKEASPSTGLEDFGKRLVKCSYNDIITLNFDRTLDRAIAAAHQLEESRIHPQRTKGMRAAQSRLITHIRVADSRVWHAHGVVDHPRTVLLGLVNYAKSTACASQAISGYREEQKRWRTSRYPTGPLPAWNSAELDEWRQHSRSSETTNASWLSQAMDSDIAFIGCGLDRAETDIWLLLHERQRQHSRKPEELRPKTFFFHPLHRFPQHITGSPASIIPAVVKSHEEAWNTVLASD